MESPWKAISDDSRREILLLLKKRDMTPSEISNHFDFSLPALSTHLKILKNADLISEKKAGQNRIYSLNRDRTLDMMKFFGNMWDYNVSSLKEYLENEKGVKKKK